MPVTGFLRNRRRGHSREELGFRAAEYLEDIDSDRAGDPDRSAVLLRKGRHDLPNRARQPLPRLDTYLRLAEQHVVRREDLYHHIGRFPSGVEHGEAGVEALRRLAEAPLREVRKAARRERDLA